MFENPNPNYDDSHLELYDLPIIGRSYTTNPKKYRIVLRKYSRSIKIGIGVLWWLTSPEKLHACDVCGGAPQLGSNAMGFSQSIPNPMIGMHFLHWGFLTDAKTSMNQLYSTRDQINSLNFSYAQYIHNRWQIQANWGINQITRNNAFNEGHTETMIGINDLSLSANYKFIDNRNNPFKPNKWVGLIGISSKLPNGLYQIRDQEKRMLPMHLQPGNGSYSIGLQSFIAWSQKSFGVALQSRIQMPFQNELDYLPGINGSIQPGVYYVLNVESRNPKSSPWKFIPQFGLKYDFNNTDKQFDQIIPTTQMQSNQLFGQLEIVGKSIYSNLFISLPLSQSSTKGSPIPQPMARISVAFILNKREKKVVE
jgi:hypothetical protein